jgi:hypothetical protein
LEITPHLFFGNDSYGEIADDLITYQINGETVQSQGGKITINTNIGSSDTVPFN